MKAILALAAFAALVACESVVPTAAEKECRERHGLMIGSTEYKDCVAKLSKAEHELRVTK